MTKLPTAVLGIVIALAGVAAAASPLLMVAGEGKMAQIALFASYLLLGPGLVGLYVAHADRYPRAGHAGFYLAFLGVMMSMPLAAVLTLGYLGVPEAVALVRSGALLPFGMAGDYTLLIGLGVVAFAAGRKGVLPRRGAMALGAGVVMHVMAQLMILPMVTWIGGSVLNAVAFAWFGYGMIAQRQRITPPPQAISV